MTRVARALQVERIMCLVCALEQDVQVSLRLVHFRPRLLCCSAVDMTTQRNDFDPLGLGRRRAKDAAPFLVLSFVHRSPPFDLAAKLLLIDHGNAVSLCAGLTRRLAQFWSSAGCSPHLRTRGSFIVTSAGFAALSPIRPCWGQQSLLRKEKLLSAAAAAACCKTNRKRPTGGKGAGCVALSL